MCLRVSRRKRGNFSLRDLSFLCYRWNIYRSALIPRKPFCHEKFLVTRLRFNSCFWRSSRGRSTVRLSAIHTEVNRKQVFAPVTISTSMTNLPQEGKSWIFFYLFIKPFSISKFAINEWYFRGTYFVDIFCHCLFLSHTVYVIFIMKKIFHNVVHTSHQARLYHFFIVEVIVEVVNFTYIYKNKMKKQLPWWRAKIT